MKYKTSLNDLQDRGGCEKLERDGFTRNEVMSEVYRHTDGMDHDSRTELVNKFYDRLHTEKGDKDVREFKERYR